MERSGPPAAGRAAGRVLAVGSSTGGTAALERLLGGTRPGFRGAILTQHLRAGMVEELARRLNALTSWDVRVARTGDALRPGLALLAPSDGHLLVQRFGESLFVRVDGGPRVHRHRPSVDVMFGSVAASLGPRAVGVLLTGMGRDGAQGLLEMRRAGARTIVQDEDSSVVFGMPKAAIELGAAERVLHLDAIPAAIDALAASPPPPS